MMPHRPRLVIAALALPLLLVAGVTGCARPNIEPATLVLRNGRISTVDPARAEAQAVAVRGDVIAWVGTNEEIQPYIGAKTEIIDLHGRRTIPGFIDSHLHFTGVGQSKMELNLMHAKNWEEIVAMVAEKVKTAKPGEWILGRGWHQEKWDHVPAPNVEGFPLHDALSKVSPNNPVILTHASGHATFANAKAMQVAGITRATSNPPGGEILKDKQGNPIGVFKEAASGLLRRGMEAEIASWTPDQVEANARKEIELASAELLSKGVTTAHDAGASFATVDRYLRMAGEGTLGVRLYVMLGESNERLKQSASKYRMIGEAGKHVTVRAIKAYADGALGSRGAWLLEPYADLPSSTGLPTRAMIARPDGTYPLADTAQIAIEKGFQLCVHAIGDRANREVLNVYEAAFKAHPDRKDLRWRIEHAQHISSTDIQRFGALGVIASMQGIHATSDGPYVLARLGAARAEEGAYVWQKLMQTHAVVANGTDAPVEEVDAIPGFYALVTRRMKDGRAFYPEQRMTRDEALRSYTLEGAYAAFEEESKGSLTPGKLADIVVLSKDIMTVPEQEIATTEVLYTIVGGKVVYKK